MKYLIKFKIRIHDLWGVFLTHVIELVNNQDIKIRNSTIDAFERAVTGALDSCVTTSLSPKAKDTHKTMTSDTESPIPETGIENMLLVALESLFSDVSNIDTQKGILRILVHVLERYGEFLSRGWEPILRLLELVSKCTDAELLSIAFQSVELLINDYFNNIPKMTQKRCLEVTSAYGNQTAAMNISLTTISLLWTAVDSFGVMMSLSHSTDNKKMDAMSLDLLLYLFSSLQSLSLDKRPEVRNSGIRAFFAVIVSYGNI